ncbi:MAG: hypothetical protein Q4B60_09375 [Erysipelotrichaceae bacterium]|nr:hypothetical protein [Erysipelotrichaceae bacterium]
MDTKTLKTNLERDLLSLGYKLYDVTYSKKDNVLSVIIDKSMDLKEVEELSNKVSSIMDMYDEDYDEYLLDVCSVGIERPIRNEEELKEAVGSYIYVKTKEIKTDGDFLSYEDGVMTLSIKDKNIKKELKIKYQDVSFVRYACKF